ncbi:hypothetical protein SAMN05216227_102418 [Pseudorhodobacter antarcticus]|jgi:uncharacterized membrane protein|uniref:Uncharacterized protein n=1 Tax=Pseudorhodobacter antarcticus TaxID=1077947 RepID=A0A1H8JAX7_9RHOB|nr:hypothetical protein [Pseudorhodobacter antarcticus]SEN77268.1 hypothetical protein SAMN05216227_102418 [Pseudorhodobacter antarcticus]
MPARIFISLIVVVILAAGATIAAAVQFGVPMVALALLAAGAALAIRFAK